jgi:hypothetical protein
MLRSLRIASFNSLLLIASGAAQAKDFLLRYDVVEFEYAKSDIKRLGEPVSLSMRHVEVKVGERGEFEGKQADQDRELTVRGKAIGLANGRLRVQDCTFACSQADHVCGLELFQAAQDFGEKPQFTSGSGYGSNAREAFVFFSARPAGATRTENDDWLTDARKQMLDYIAKQRKDRAAERDNKEQAAASLLELALKQLSDLHDDGATGRMTLEAVIQKYGDTQAGRDAKKTWNQLPNVGYKYYPE